MQDIASEYEERVRSAGERLRAAQESLLQKHREDLLEADVALEAAMEHRLRVLKGTEPEGERPKPPEKRPAPLEVRTVRIEPPAADLSDLEEKLRLLGQNSEVSRVS